jgi:hypothetical protein
MCVTDAMAWTAPGVDMSVHGLTIASACASQLFSAGARGGGALRKASVVAARPELPRAPNRGATSSRCTTVPPHTDLTTTCWMLTSGLAELTATAAEGLLRRQREDEKSIFRPGVLFGEIHIAPYALPSHSTRVLDNDGHTSAASGMTG